MRFGSAIGSAGWSVAGSVSPPAIWGKLPSHADYVTHGVRADEVEALQRWLAGQVRPLPSAPHQAKTARTPTRQATDRWLALEPARYQPSPHSIPVAFVLPPGVLPFSGPHHVLGVVANSCDRLGRQHPLIVYQRANARWLRQHFASLGDTGQDAQDAQDMGGRESVNANAATAGLRQPWLFWLARLVSRYARHPDAPVGLDEPDTTPLPTGTPPTLSAAVLALWELHAPGWSQWVGVAQRAPHATALQAVIDGAANMIEHDAADDLRGVAHAPWADWPDRIWGARPTPAYWQQDSYGGYVGASKRLGELWGR